jgi:hypothetical protein
MDKIDHYHHYAREVAEWLEGSSGEGASLIRHN